MTNNKNLYFQKGKPIEPLAVSGRNKLNDLDGKEWIKNTKSVWMNTKSQKEMKSFEMAIDSGVLLSESPPRDSLKKNHPATFSENDITKLIQFFTKKGETVLDPFLGTGSSGISSIKQYRNFVGIELYSEWLSIAKKRITSIDEHLQESVNIKLYCGDALDIMYQFPDNSIDLIVTSPPYWGILNKNDHKAKRERISKGFATNYGNDTRDLSLTKDYATFLKLLSMHFKEYYRLLKPKKYTAIVVSDFRHGQEYYMFHSDVANILKNANFIIQGLIVLVQDNKKLYPYGYPSTYVPNISNQFVVLGRKLL